MIKCPQCGAHLDGSPDAAEKLARAAKSAVSEVKEFRRNYIKNPVTLKNSIRCPQCGFEGQSETFTKGSFGLELVLWFLFIFPGLIYSIWRLSSRYKGCPSCKWEHVVRIS